MWIILLIVIGLLIYFFVQNQNTKNKTPQTQNESPLDILKRRYAKGEISTEEYEKMKKELE